MEKQRKVVHHKKDMHRFPILLTAFCFAFGCQSSSRSLEHIKDPAEQRSAGNGEKSSEVHRLAAAAESIIDPTIIYDPAYVVIPYPNGDVPAHTGVCTDVVVRSFRIIGRDLQKEVHEDMAKNFSKYPNKWGRTSPDRNIDHRRVPNLMTFFQRKGYTQTISQKASDYKPGDIVTWILDKGLTHIGIVSTQRSKDGKRFLMVHNIGAGQVLEDCLFAYTITGHYRL